jgi:hypothetical protein
MFRAVGADGSAKARARQARSLDPNQWQSDASSEHAKPVSSQPSASRSMAQAWSEAHCRPHKGPPHPARASGSRRSLASPAHSGIDGHCAGESAADNDRVHAKDAVGEKGRDHQRSERDESMPSSRSPWARIAATAVGPLASPIAAMKPPSPRSLRVCRAAGGNAPMCGRCPRSYPQKSRAIRPRRADRKRPGLHADQSDRQADRNPGGEEGDAGAIAVAQHVPNLCDGLLDAAGRAHRRHDVAELDFCFRRQRDLLASALQVTQNIPGASSPMRVTSSVKAQPCRAGTSTTTSKTSPDT